MHSSRCIYFKKHLGLIGKNQNELRENLRKRLRGSLEWITFQPVNERSMHAFFYLNEYRAVLGTKHFLMYLIAIILKYPIRRIINNLK
jgi:hypothetical protein